MKIKEVSKQTGLTDKAIRFYISKGLVDVNTSENYNGRKSFDFTEDNVKALKDIAVLRNAGFSVEDIHTIKNNPSKSYEISQKLLSEKEIEILQSKKLKNSLKNLVPAVSYTTSTLADLLRQEMSDENITYQNEKTQLAIRLKNSILPLILLVCLSAVFLAHLYQLHLDYRYISIKSGKIIQAVVMYSFFLLPIIAVTARLIKKRKSDYFPLSFSEVVLKSAIIILFVSVYFIYSTFCLFASPFCSQTRNIREYSYCVRGQEDLFPVFATGENPEFYYMYKKEIDYTYDIFAQWELDKEEFSKEIERVKTEYPDSEYVQWGDYECIFIYDSFEKASNPDGNYNFLVFAYNNNINTVRYIKSVSLENGADIPYFINQF